MIDKTIKTVALACAKLEKDPYVLNLVEAPLFLYKENVQKMADAVAKNLHTHFEEVAQFYTLEQIDAYALEVQNIKDNFKAVVKEKLLEVHKINPKEVAKAEVKEKINNFGKDVI